MKPNEEHEADHHEHQRRAGTAEPGRLRQVDGGQVERSCVLRAEIVVALVEGGVDGVCQQQGPRELELVLRGRRRSRSPEAGRDPR